MASSADYILSERCEKFTARASSPYINRSPLLNSQRRLLASSSLTSGSGRGRRIDGVSRSRQVDSNDRYWCDRARKRLRELESLEHAVLITAVQSCLYLRDVCMYPKKACVYPKYSGRHNCSCPLHALPFPSVYTINLLVQSQPRRVPAHRINVKPARIARHTITELPDTVPR